VYRVGDVPGFEIPVRYFQYLRTGDRRHVDGVLEHNRQDIVSLAVLTSYALWLAEEGPDACREPGEQLALGRLYARAGQVDRATAAFERAAHAGADADTRRQALAHIATSLRRARRYEEAARHWQQVLELAPGHGEPWSSLDRRAAEALAIHHEHRSKDIEAARRYAARLEPQASGAFRRDLERRVTRIERKLRGKSLNEKLSL
jgi:hypothetical protein